MRRLFTDELRRQWNDAHVRLRHAESAQDEGFADAMRARLEELSHIARRSGVAL